jgi:hypothetical protein
MPGNNGFGDFVKFTHASERDLARHLRSELFDLLFVTQASIALGWYDAGTDHVHPNLSSLQIGGPGTSKGTDRGFGRAINAERFHANRGNDRCVEDDSASVLQQGKRFLDCKKQSFNVDVKDLMTSAPSLRKRWAVAKPRPLVPTVIRVIFPFNLLMMSFVLGFSG